MEPSTRRRVLIAAGVVFALAVIGTLAGVLTRVAMDNRSQRQASAERALQQALALLAPGAPAPAPARNASSAPPGPPADPKAPFYPESQSPQDSLFMVLGPDALSVAAQSGQLPLAWAGLGPCRSIRSVSNVSLDLSAAGTGCRGAQCAINLRVTLPAAGSCAAFPAPWQTIYFISGYSCSPAMYTTLVERLASWGYAVMQYDRPMGGAFTPTSETESAYFASLLTWRNRENNTRGSSFAGAFSAGAVGIMGHSMGGGLTAILSGMYPNLVGAAVMLEPVDYTQLSLRVARQFLVEYKEPVLVVQAGVQCTDRNGCVPPQDHVPSAAEEAAWAAQGLCRPSWWCCSWDDWAPGLETKTAVTQPTDGPSGFVEFAAPGSWLARMGQAGHTSFLDPGSVSGINCPTVSDNAVVQPDAATLATAFFAARLRGEPGAEDMTMAWAAAKLPQTLTLGVTPQLGVAVV